MKELERRGLDVAGTKPLLVARLLEALQAQPGGGSKVKSLTAYEKLAKMESSSSSAAGESTLTDPSAPHQSALELLSSSSTTNKKAGGGKGRGRPRKQPLASGAEVVADIAQLQAEIRELNVELAEVKGARDRADKVRNLAGERLCTLVFL